MNYILSILLLNRNNSDDVLAIYEDLKNQTFQNFNVVIIDDNSDASELKKLSQMNDDRVLVYSYESPWKFGIDKKFNYGMKKSINTGSTYTYNLQTDMEINSIDLLEKLISYMEGNNECGAACPTIFDSNGKMAWGPGIEKSRMGKTYNINESIIFRNSVIEKMGYVNEKLIYYGSEFYYQNWMKINNYTTAPIEGVSITHKSGGTSSQYWDYKFYYRPRTTILIMKLFNKDDGLLQKIIYLRQECSEIEARLKEYIRGANIFGFIKLSFIFIIGLLSGLITHIKTIENP